MKNFYYAISEKMQRIVSRRRWDACGGWGYIAASPIGVNNEKYWMDRYGIDDGHTRSEIKKC
jgi:hypothetical protein